MITSDMFISLSYTGVRGYNKITTYDANYRDAKLGKRVLTTSYGQINVGRMRATPGTTEST